ncbi:GNAT family N-acetyltransferase [Flavobacteriaceae bacterium F89]|uniref:GNAT family N-acetyltransferase n=1 Tax=Cerina litoralis TaxID=2874477 RepID=A0AAE3EUK8_9FLAO|nr:GNAT family N-acetyltransferase [Cerina litoralis]MCG2461198.1 GNAT family N-acetyltransferase [Cerina litoralis]
MHTDIGYNLKIDNFSDKNKIEKYRNLLYSNWKNNAYYSYEYLNHYGSESNELMYFIFEKFGEPIILMPFILRSIKLNNKITNYFDVTTPYGYAGPILKDTCSINEYGPFWNAVDKWYRQNNIITEFVRFGLIDNHHYYNGDLVSTLKNIKGKILMDQQVQWDNFLPKVRNNYRRAQQFNLTFKLFKNQEINDAVITSFHDIYIKTMLRREASEDFFFSLAYFKNLIYSNLDSFFIVLIYLEDKAISTELIISYKNTCYAYLGGTIGDFFHCRPNDFLRVEMIRWASEHGVQYYILGGGRKNDDGLYKNKKSLFPKDEDVIFYTGRKVLNEQVYKELNRWAEKEDFEGNTQENQSFFPYYRRFNVL